MLPVKIRNEKTNKRLGPLIEPVSAGVGNHHPRTLTPSAPRAAVLYFVALREAKRSVAADPLSTAARQPAKRFSVCNFQKGTSGGVEGNRRATRMGKLPLLLGKQGSLSRAHPRADDG